MSDVLSEIIAKNESIQEIYDDNFEEDLEKIERFLEALDATCFPIQIDWNNTDLYTAGIYDALKECYLRMVAVE